MPPRVTLAARPPDWSVQELPGSRRRGRRGGLLGANGSGLAAGGPRWARRRAGSGQPTDGSGAVPGDRGGSGQPLAGYVCGSGWQDGTAGGPAPADGSLVAVEQHAHRARLVQAALRGTPGDVDVVGGMPARWAVPSPGFYWTHRAQGSVPVGGRSRAGAARFPTSPTWQPCNGACSTTPSTSVNRGVVAYVTCSPHLAETDLVVEDVLRARDDAVQEDAGALLPEVPGVCRRAGDQVLAASA